MKLLSAAAAMSVLAFAQPQVGALAAREFKPTSDREFRRLEISEYQRRRRELRRLSNTDDENRRQEKQRDPTNYEVELKISGDAKGGVHYQFSHPINEDWATEWREVADDGGRISLDGFIVHMLHEDLESIKSDEDKAKLRGMMKKWDTDADGSLDFQEFIKMRQIIAAENVQAIVNDCNTNGADVKWRVDPETMLRTKPKSRRSSEDFLASENGVSAKKKTTDGHRNSVEYPASDDGLSAKKKVADFNTKWIEFKNEWNYDPEAPMDLDELKHFMKVMKVHLAFENKPLARKVLRLDDTEFWMKRSSNGDGMLEHDEFVTMMKTITDLAQYEGVTIFEVGCTFNVHDLDEDGFWTLYNMFKYVEPFLAPSPNADTTTVFDRFDTNEDGLVDVVEFTKRMLDVRNM